MFILNTDVLSNLRKQKKHPVVQAWLLSTPQADLCTTVISIAEINAASSGRCRITQTTQ
jgi:predicted nucleic acid-binding protein